MTLKKRVPAQRTAPRVEMSEDRKVRGVTKSQVKPLAASAKIVDGQVQVTGQIAEVVPVAQYANVTLLAGLQWNMGGIDMSQLVDADWGDEDEDGVEVFDYNKLTDIQKVEYDKIRGALRATSKIIEHAIAEDRDTVDRSVRAHNEREEAEKKEERKSSGSRRR